MKMKCNSLKDLFAALAVSVAFFASPVRAEPVSVSVIVAADIFYSLVTSLGIANISYFSLMASPVVGQTKAYGSPSIFIQATPKDFRNVNDHDLKALLNRIHQAYTAEIAWLQTLKQGGAIVSEARLVKFQKDILSWTATYAETQGNVAIRLDSVRDVLVSKGWVKYSLDQDFAQQGETASELAWFVGSDWFEPNQCDPNKMAKNFRDRGYTIEAASERLWSLHNEKTGRRCLFAFYAYGQKNASSQIIRSPMYGGGTGKDLDQIFPVAQRNATRAGDYRFLFRPKDHAIHWIINATYQFGPNAVYQYFKVPLFQTFTVENPDRPIRENNALYCEDLHQEDPCKK